MVPRKKIIRITTVASTMNVILRGQLAFLSKSFDVIGITSPDDFYFSEISQREKIIVYPVEMRRKISLWNDIISLIRIIIIFRLEKPDIVHSQTPKAGLLGMLAAWLTQVPIRVHSVVGIPMFIHNRGGLKRYILRITEKLTYYFATHIYPNSFGLKNIILQNNLCNPSKLKIIGHGSSNGIDTNFFSPFHFSNNFRNNLKKELNIPENSFIFSYVGRVVKDKGIHELLLAFISFLKVIRTKKKEVFLLIVGPLRKNDDPIAKEDLCILLNHRYIKYLGLQRDVRPYLSISDVFVFPSHREGLPGSLLQACSMGLPAIATDIVGNNELVIHEVNGLLVPPKNYVELQFAMTKLYENPALISKFAKESRRLISEKYEQAAFWENLSNEYKLLLAKSLI